MISTPKSYVQSFINVHSATFAQPIFHAFFKNGGKEMSEHIQI